MIKVERIISRNNSLLTHIRKLGNSRAYRRKQGEFVCDGVKLLWEAMQWGAEITTLLVTEGMELSKLPDGARIACVSEELMHSVSPLETPQGVIFACRIPQSEGEELSEGGRHIVLEGLQDPGNVGTIIRTANAFSINSVILMPGCADPYNPKTVRATMGAVFRQTIVEMELPELKSFVIGRGIPLFAAALGEQTTDVRETELIRSAVVIGSEGAGISAEMLSICDGSVQIPMKECCESLNAGIAASIIMWEMSRKAL